MIPTKIVSKILQGTVLIALILPTTDMNAQLKDLDSPQRSIVSISALTATGDVETLKQQLNAGLDAGLSINEIKEILTQLYAYCGFPRSLNAITTFMKVLEERKSKGTSDKEGKKIVISQDVSGKYEIGRKVLEKLTKTTQPKPAPGFGEFAPRIDAFLKEHLFADVFESDVLTYQQRELATISALSAMPGIEAQLQAHIKIGMNTGISEGQLEQVAMLIDQYVNMTQGNSIRKLLSKPAVLVSDEEMMVRIAEIEVDRDQLTRYNEILKEQATVAVKTEPGVIAILPMYQKDDPAQIRILEIYASKAAYQSHLQTQHFLHYKTSTREMVKSLKLVDMEAIDKETIRQIMEKL